MPVKREDDFERVSLPYALSNKAVENYTEWAEKKDETYSYTSRENEFYERFEKCWGAKPWEDEDRQFLSSRIMYTLDEFEVGYIRYHWDQWASLTFVSHSSKKWISIKCDGIEHGLMYLWLYLADQHPDKEQMLIKETEEE